MLKPIGLRKKPTAFV